MNKKIAIFSLCVTVLSSRGGSACKTTNQVSDTFPSNSLAYKKELVSQLSGKDLNQLSYWFDKYVEIDGKEFMRIKIQGEGICAEGFLLIKEWDKKIEDTKRVKGESYKGAQLTRLRFRTENQTDLIYRHLDKIVD